MRGSEAILMRLVAVIALATLGIACSGAPPDTPASEGTPPAISTLAEPPRETTDSPFDLDRHISPDGVLSVTGTVAVGTGEVTLPWEILHDSCDFCRHEGASIVREEQFTLEVDVAHWPAGEIYVQGRYQRPGHSWATDYQLLWNP